MQICNTCIYTCIEYYEACSCTCIFEQGLLEPRQYPSHAMESIFNKMPVTSFYLFIFFKKLSKSKPLLSCALDTVKECMTQCTWPAVTYQHSAPRSSKFQLLCTIYPLPHCHYDAMSALGGAGPRFLGHF